MLFVPQIGSKLESHLQFALHLTLRSVSS